MTFDFSSYYVDENKLQEPQSPLQPGESFDFSEYYVQEPSIASEFVRHVTRTAARATESILGFPGDFVGFAKYLGDKLPDAPSFMQSDPNFVQKAGKKALESLPTSEQLKEFSSYLTSGFTDPQGAREELGDEITSLATVLAIPAKNPSKFKGLIKSIGQAAAAKGSGKTAEAFGATPAQQAFAEIGTLFLTGMISKPTADKFVSDQYKQTRKLIPQGTMVNTGRMERSLKDLETKLARGLSTQTKNEVSDAARELSAKASGGAMEIDEIVESFHNVNERMGSKKLFDELSKPDRKILRTRYNELKDILRDEIKDYGKSNPDFYKDWSQLNNAYATIQESKVVSNFLQSKLGSIPRHLVGSAALDLFLGSPSATAATLGGYSAVKSGELLARIAKSPKLRQHYMNILLEASNENLPAVIKNLEDLNKEVDKPNK